MFCSWINREGICPSWKVASVFGTVTAVPGGFLPECGGFLVSVNSSNAVDKREQPPRKDGCSLFHVNARLRRKKMERRLREKQVPIGLLSKQVVLEVEEAAQLSGRGIRHKVEGAGISGCSRPQRRLSLQKGSPVICPAQRYQPRMRRFAEPQNRTLRIIPFLQALGGRLISLQGGSSGSPLS